MKTIENFIDEVINFYPFDKADEYRINESLKIGFLPNVSKINLLMDQDTKFSENFDNYDKIATSIGFNVIYEENFAGNIYENKLPKTETLRVYWHNDGLLLIIESFSDYVNKANVYYNVRFNDNAKWVIATGSCAYTDHGVWVGNHDVRAGLKHKINSIRQNGLFLAYWIERPFFFSS